MAKLRDVFPRWALREPQRDGDLDLGGGSAFAHLAEDTNGVFTNGHLGGFNPVADASWDVAESYFDMSMDDNGNFGFTVVNQAAAPGSWLYLSQAGDANDRFEVGYDGSLHWGDGSSPPDVALSRTSGGKFGRLDNGSLVTWDNPDTPTLKSELSPGELFLMAAANTWVDITAPSAADQPSIDVLLPGSGRFQVHGDGSLHWGDGTAAPDVSLSRDSGSGWWGSGLVVDDALFVVANQGIGVVEGVTGPAASHGARLQPGWLIIDASEAATVAVTAAGNHLLGIDQPGGGVQLKSPGGTAYNITVTDDGTLDVTAA